MKRSYRKPKNKTAQIKEYRINEQIRAKVVRLVDEENGDIEDISRDEAIERAVAKELDLVEVAPNVSPPVVRIMDYGRHQYMQSKMQRKQRQVQKKTEIKGIRLSPRIGVHDLEVRKKNALKFLKKGAKVKVEVQLRGREHKHINLTKQLVKDFVDSLGEDVIIEQPIAKHGHTIQTIVAQKQA